MKLLARLSVRRSNENKDSHDSSFLGRLIQSIEMKKRAFANFLSQHYEPLSKRNKKLSLLAFGMVMGGVSLYLILSPFAGAPDSWSFSEKTEIPKPIIRQPTEPLVTKEEHDLLVSYRSTLDSLKLHDPVSYEILLSNRQGLIDSLNFLISLYP